jgi:hypothetical protein
MMDYTFRDGGSRKSDERILRVSHLFDVQVTIEVGTQAFVCTSCCVGPQVPHATIERGSCAFLSTLLRSFNPGVMYGHDFVTASR